MLLKHAELILQEERYLEALKVVAEAEAAEAEAADEEVEEVDDKEVE